MYIIVAIIFVIAIFTIYSIIGSLSNKDEDEYFENDKTDNKKHSKFIDWVFSGKHPQQKYAQTLYKKAEEDRIKAEIEELKRDKNN